MNDIKSYNSLDAITEIAHLEAQAKQLTELTLLIQEITNSKEIKTVPELNAWLCTKTGFESPRFASDSLDLLDAYENILMLSSDIFITPDKLTPSKEVKPSVIKKIKESHTVYYSKEEQKTIDSYRKMRDIFNSLPANFRQGAIINREAKIIHQKFN